MFSWHKREEVIEEATLVQESLVIEEAPINLFGEKTYEELKSEVFIEKEKIGKKAARGFKKFLIWFVASLIYGIVITLIPVMLKVRLGAIPTMLLAGATFFVAKEITARME